MAVPPSRMVGATRPPLPDHGDELLDPLPFQLSMTHRDGHAVTMERVPLRLRHAVDAIDTLTLCPTKVPLSAEDLHSCVEESEASGLRVQQPR